MIATSYSHFDCYYFDWKNFDHSFFAHEQWVLGWMNFWFFSKIESSGMIRVVKERQYYAKKMSTQVNIYYSHNGIKFWKIWNFWKYSNNFFLKYMILFLQNTCILSFWYEKIYISLFTIFSGHKNIFKFYINTQILRHFGS